MPSPQDLDKFRSSFRTIGGELTALSSRGETYEDIDLPEGGGTDTSARRPPSVDDLFGAEASASVDGDAEPSTEGAPSQDESFDFGAFLDSIPDDLSELAPPPPEQGEAPLESADLESTSLEQPPEETAEPPFEPSAETGEGKDDMDFGLPEGLLDGLAEEVESGREESGPADEAPFGDFDLDATFGAAEPEAPSMEEPPAPEGAPPEEAPFGDFDLDATFGAAEPEAAEPSMEEPTVGEGAPPEEAPFGDFDLDATFGAAEPEAPSMEEPTAPEGAPPEEVPFGDFDLDATFGAAEPEAPSKEEPTVGEGAPAEESPFGDFDLDATLDAAGLGESPPSTEESIGSDAAPEQSSGEPLEEFPDGADAFSLFSEEAPPTAGEEPPSESPPPEQSGADDFSVPDFPADFGAGSEPSFGDTPPSFEAGEGVPSDAGETFDSFDTFSLDNDFLSPGFGDEGEKTLEGGTDDGFAQLEDFSLEGIDDIFRGAQAKETAPLARERKGGKTAPSAEVEEIILSEQDLEKLEATLSSYPLNLRIACEELIAEHVVPPEDMATLVRSLVRGMSAKEMAVLAGRLIGRSIPIPRGFEKRTGEELEAERSTFAYAFTHNILPVLRIFAFVAVLATSVVYLSFEFIYRPLRAQAYYKQGYERIGVGEYARANERFDQGFRLLRSKNWFYKYARGFADARQYLLAEEKFDQLLKLYPRDKKGALLYADMESKELRNYAKADRILRDQILDYRVDDRDGLLAQGDNNLAWAEQEPARYEEARKDFARLIERYGDRDEYLERMLLYFIRTDKLAEVLPLQDFFLSSEKRKISGSTLAELGGYLLDKKEEVPVGVSDPNVERIENLRKLLERAVRTDPAYPESYYHLARYFERYGKVSEERRALEGALAAFASASELSSRRTGYRIDAHRRYASLLVKEKEFLPAEQQLVEGLRIYEDALRRRILMRSGNFGRLYSDLGDLEYFKAGDLDAAMSDYRTAAQNGWSPPEIRYRMGFISYANEDWGAAVESFYDASAELPLNRRLMFALGNALYRRGDLRAAEGYYNRLLDMLEAERARFPVLVPNSRPEHAELAERLMRARNNLGVTLDGLAERTGDSRYRSRALALYSESARAWDALTRDPTTMVRSAQVNLAYLNTRGSLYPKVPYEPQIYAEIDKDVQDPSEWEKLLAE